MDEFKALLPLLNLRLKVLLEGAEADALREEEVVIEDLLRRVERVLGDDKAASLLVGPDLHLNVIPLLAHVGERRLNVMLTGRHLADLHDGALVDLKVERVHILQREQRDAGAHLEAELAGDLVPVALLHTLLAQVADDGKDGLELVDLAAHVLGDAEDRRLVLEARLLAALLHVAEGRRHILRHLFRVNRLERVVRPPAVPLQPVVSCVPQQRVGLKVFIELVYIRIVRLLAVEETLVRVEEGGLIAALADVLQNALHLSGNL